MGICTAHSRSSKHRILRNRAAFVRRHFFKVRHKNIRILCGPSNLHASNHKGSCWFQEIFLSSLYALLTVKSPSNDCEVGPNSMSCHPSYSVHNTAKLYLHEAGKALSRAELEGVLVFVEPFLFHVNGTLSNWEWWENKVCHFDPFVKANHLAVGISQLSGKGYRTFIYS
ncbi:hypothetical protein GOBAR_DD35826 [Gossypium barbadense]|nr:hypothetical protein GOBAR_DD35826 [Gossypium barbadense]